MTNPIELAQRRIEALEKRIAALTEHRGILLNAASIARHMDTKGLAESSGIRPIISALELQLGAMAADDAQAKGEKA